MERISKVNGYVSYLPDVLKDIIQFKATGESIDIELDTYYEGIQQLLNNGFVDTSTLEVVKRWEKIFEINNPIDADLQSRRNAIKAKMIGQPPINISTLKDYTETYLGVPVNIVIHENPYVIKMQYKGITELPDMSPYYAAIYNLVPANIQVLINYAFRTWRSLKNSTWQQLKLKTWYEVLYDL